MYVFSPNNRPNRKKWIARWPSKINWKVLGRWFLYFCLAGLLLVIGIFVYFAKDLPSPAKLASRSVIQSTKIYDRTGDHLLYEVHGEEKRTQVSIKELPDALKFATITLEDQNFYTNHGIEVTSIIRAGLADILHRRATQGASTITQQLIKQTMLTSEKTLSRKIKEAILSIELAQKFSKDEILEMYLNQIPYGSNAYGTEAAAQTFFGKHAKDLSLDESAILASLPQAPSYYSPYGNHTDGLKARQEYALDQMAELGYITSDQADEAKGVDVISKIKPFSDNISAPHFVMYIKDYLEQKYGEQAVEEGGLKVYTTLDWDKQQAAEQAIRDHIDKNAKTYRANNAALVAMDPKTGQILAMVGSKDYFAKASPDGCISGKTCTFEGNFNVATANRQPGSSFKPYVYLTAFKKGFTPETQLWDVDTNFSTDDGKIYNPKNYDGKNHGLLQMKDALAMSLNVPAVKTLYLAGIKDSITTAKSLGITSLKNSNNYGLTLVLGGGEVTLLDHVNAYGSLATGGIHHDKIAVLKILDSSGDIVEEYKDNPGERAVEEKFVAMLDHIMSTNSLRAPVFGDNNPLSFNDKTVAAKTGTTNEWRDGWTMGYTPSLVVGVWAGNNDNSTMAQGADGIFTAAPIWREFMDSALKNYTKEDFPKYEKDNSLEKDILNGTYDPIGKIEVCKKKNGNYCLANDACPQDYSDKKTFFSGHTILWYINKDDPRGDPPKDPEDDPQFKNWEKAVQEYAKKNKDYSKDSAPTDKCKSSDFSGMDPSIKIDAPSSVNASSFNIKVSSSSPFGIAKTVLSVDGDEVVSNNSSSIDYNYAIPSGKNNYDIKIEASTTDKNDSTKTDSTTVHVAIP
jgi:1A family penicillin-binding protein